MKRLTIALFGLARAVFTSPVKPTKPAPNNLHWTKFDKPFDEMTEVDRRAAAERLAGEMIGVIKDLEK